jgi:hypothetical protein
MVFIWDVALPEVFMTDKLYDEITLENTLCAVLKNTESMPLDV